MEKNHIQPKIYYFEDDGIFPNSKYPVLLYKQVFSETGEAAAEWLEKTFKNNNWYNGWRDGVYSYHHYHSNTQEVLGVYAGRASILLGGDKGELVGVASGDVVIIPPGVAHKCISKSDDFMVVGAYPNGKNPDLNRGEENERPQADKKIANVPIPDTDPLLGENAGLVEIWNKL